VTYLYKCNKCKKEVAVVKPISDSGRVEHCEVCKNVLIRVYTASAISTADGFKQ